MKDQPPEEASYLPEGAREHTFLVYHAGSGEIVHGHKAIVFPSEKDAPSVDELEKQALEFAVDATDHDASSLKTVMVEFDELEPGVEYRVDPEKGQLERQSPRQTSA